jgi:hypothetical protein
VKNFLFVKEKDENSDYADDNIEKIILDDS